jgi:hypothetical protein
MKYGMKLVNKAPRPFIKLLVNLCKGEYEFFRPPSSDYPVTPTECLPLEPLVSLFIGKDDLMRMLLERVLLVKTSQGGTYSLVPPSSTNGSSSSISETISYLFIDIHLKEYRNCINMLQASQGISTSNEIKELKTNLKHTEELIITFLDLNEIQPDNLKIKLLFHTYHFQPGMLFLMEKKSSPEILLQKYMEIGDSKALFRLLRKEGRKRSEISSIILQYFVQSVPPPILKSPTSSPTRPGNSSPKKDPSRVKDSDDEEEEEDEDDEDEENDDDDDDEEARWDNVCEALSIIEKEAVLSPIEILNILSSNPHLPVHVAFEFTQKQLHNLQDEVSGLTNNVHQMFKTIGYAEEDMKKIKRVEDMYKFRGVDRRNIHQKQSRKGNKDDDDDGDDDGENDQFDEFKDDSIQHGDDDNDGGDEINHLDAEEEAIDFAANIDVQFKEQTQERKKWDAIRKAQLDRACKHIFLYLCDILNKSYKSIFVQFLYLYSFYILYLILKF